ncbi:hypothetical protein BC834DRAFT_911147 [Gloeopeniophorella convolvens]|nr:hypothetical protein BC834DRAFT_911147 [Gloeopeniophorella convolvens]
MGTLPRTSAMQQPPVVTMLATIVLAIAAGLTVSRILFTGKARDLGDLHVIKPLSFVVPPSEPVLMRITESARYDIDTALGAEEFERLTPDSGHVVHISDSSEADPKPYTVTLFHQLKCLGIIRDAYMGLGKQEQPGTLARHCMNYLRQTILCRPNTRLESVKLERGAASRDYETVCLDWTKIYEEAERNQQAYATQRAGD